MTRKVREQEAVGDLSHEFDIISMFFSGELKQGALDYSKAIPSVMGFSNVGVADDGSLVDENVGEIDNEDDQDIYRFAIGKYSAVKFTSEAEDGGDIALYLTSKSMLQNNIGIRIESEKEYNLKPGEYFVIAVPVGGVTDPLVEFEPIPYGINVSITEDKKITNDLIEVDAMTFNIKGTLFGDTLVGKNGMDNTMFGGAGADILIGRGGHDILMGGSGADTMSGGAGSDIYVVDNAKDVILFKDEFGASKESEIALYEDEDFSSDSLWTNLNVATLNTKLENLKLLGVAKTGVGNGKDNWIIGNNSVNVLSGLAGDDILLGGGGADTLIGGAGDDTLDGGAGRDSLVGGAGNDTYVYDNQTDIIVEKANEGIDTLIASTDVLKMALNVENIILVNSNSQADALLHTDNDATSMSYDPALKPPTVIYDSLGDDAGLPITAIGNSLNNVITGNQAGNILSGGAGNDTIFGGAGGDVIEGGEGSDVLYGGESDNYTTFESESEDEENELVLHAADVFVFKTSLSKAGVDEIMDFSAGNDSFEQDIIQLSSLVFKGMGIGQLSEDEFGSYINYDSATGELSYDASGSGNGTVFAIIHTTNDYELSHQDIFVI